MKIFFALLLFSCNTIVFSQTFGWVKTFGDDSFDRGIDICVDDYGDVITTGFTEGVVEYEQGDPNSVISGFGIEDVFTTKHSPNGDLYWNGLIGGLYNEFPIGVTTDSERNVISVGRFHNVVDFDPGIGQFNITPVDFYDIYISKLDPNGNLIWVKSIGSDNMDAPTSVALDSDNNIYFTGYSYGYIDVDPGPSSTFVTSDFFVVKLTPEGEFVWVQTFNGAGTNSCGDMVIDDEDNLILTGVLDGTVDFDPGPNAYELSKNGPVDIFICKIDSSGTFQWAKQIGNFGGYGQSFALDNGPSEELFLTGYYSGTLDFDPGVGVNSSTSNGSDDTYILKLNSSGDFEWVKTFGGTGDEWSHAVAAGPYGDVYVTGRFQDTLDVDPNAGVQTFISEGMHNMFVSRFDSNGDLVSSAHISGANYVCGFGLAIGHSGEVYCTGDFMTTVDFDPSNLNNDITVIGNTDVFILRLDPEDLSNKLDLSFGVTLSPNPTKDVLNISGVGSMMNRSVVISDLMGNVIEELTLTSNTVDVSRFESGVYLIQIDDQVMRFVKQ